MHLIGLQEAKSEEEAPKTSASESAPVAATTPADPAAEPADWEDLLVSKFYRIHFHLSISRVMMNP